ncbi:hypothetical protein AND_001323 [Anopheles darlingi]|uniref:Uncharacterized protein n=1 Tax=Anopheles darlingi TaxID=43151 RepID=W5JV94_ANODA|nr:hypothetical protein AND_001323 [Anopheles darlingi]
MLSSSGLTNGRIVNPDKAAGETGHNKPTPPAASGKLEPGSEAKKDEIECCNCALIQRKWDEDRARHTQETVRLNEQINYLQVISFFSAAPGKAKRDVQTGVQAGSKASIPTKLTLSMLSIVPLAHLRWAHTGAPEQRHPQQLTLAGNVEMGLKQTMTEHQQRLEQKLLELSATVDVKQCLEGPLIRAQHRKLKDTRNRLKVAERDRATLRQQIADLVVDNEKKELLLQAQDTNIERVKSELHAIRRLSIRQIEYLDDDTVDDTAASHRQVTEHSYALDSPTYSAFSPETQLKSEARSSTGRLVPATNVDDDDDDVLRPETSQPVTSQPATGKIRLDGASSSTSANSLVPDGSRMPSAGVTVASDRDGERSTSASSCFVASNTWMTASMLTLYTASTWTPVPPPEATVTMARDDADDDDDDDHHHRHLIAELIDCLMHNRLMVSSSLLGAGNEGNERHHIEVIPMVAPHPKDA